MATTGNRFVRVARRTAPPAVLLAAVWLSWPGAAPVVPATAAGQGAAAIERVEATRDGGTVTLTWTADGPVDVLLAGDPEADPGRMTVVSAADRDGRHVVRDLRGITRPYFYLRGGAGRGRRVAVRVLPLEGGRNFRDLGGYPTRDGRRVKWGRVFRSGFMTDLTDADYEYLSALGIRVVCDFRSEEERAARPTRWRAAPTIEYRTWSYSDADDPGGMGLGSLLSRPHLTPESVARIMTRLYPNIVEEHKAKYRDLFHSLAAGELPLAFNCSAGKDRAGTAAALILSALGVPREIVVRDYALSERVVDYEADLPAAGAGREERASDRPPGGLPAALMRPLLRSDPAYIRSTLAYLDATYGGVLEYIRTALDIADAELARIRELLLE